MARYIEKDDQEIKATVRERCSFSTFPQDYMVDPMILQDIAQREGVEQGRVQKLYQEVCKEREAELDGLIEDFFAQA